MKLYWSEWVLVIIGDNQALWYSVPSTQRHLNPLPSALSQSAPLAQGSFLQGLFNSTKYENYWFSDIPALLALGFFYSFLVWNTCPFIIFAGEKVRYIVVSIFNQIPPKWFYDLEMNAKRKKKKKNPSNRHDNNFIVF